MAGVQGMASPNKVQPIIPQTQTPQGVAIQQSPVQTVSDEIDYESLANEVIGGQQAPSQTPNDIDYEALANEVIGTSKEQAPLDREAPSLSEQFQQAPVRFQASFAQTDKEKQFVLDRAYGSDNVRKKGDEFQIYKGGKWKKFDSDNFELIGDVMDIARPAFEEITAGAGTIAGLGMAAGSTATGVGAVAAPAIVVGSRAAGGAIGHSLADTYAESILGIPRDIENRGGLSGRLAESATSGAANALFLGIGDNISEYLSKRASSKATDLLTRELSNKTQDDIKVLKASTETLENSGLLPKVGVNYLPEQATMGEVKDIAKQASYISDAKEVITAKEKIFELSKNVIQDINNKIAPIIGKTKKGKEILSAANSIEDAQAEMLGSFRDDFLSINKDVKLPTDKIQKALIEIPEQLGYVPGTKDVPENEASYIFKKQFEKITNMLQSRVDPSTGVAWEGSEKQLTGKELADFYKSISSVAKDLWEKGSNLTPSEKATINLWGAVRDDYSYNIKNTMRDKQLSSIIPGIKAKTYGEALDGFANIKNSSLDLKSLLLDPKSGEATITAEALADGIYSKGKATLKNIQAFENLFRDAPEMVTQVRRIKLDNLLQKSYDSVSETYNGVKYINSILELPADVAEHLAGGKEGLNMLKAARVYANRVQNYTVKDISENPEAKKGVLNLLSYSGRLIHKGADAAINFIANSGKDQSVAKYLSAEGRDEILAMTPKPMRQRMQNHIDSIIGSATRFRTFQYNMVLRNQAVKSTQNNERKK